MKAGWGALLLAASCTSPVDSAPSTTESGPSTPTGSPTTSTWTAPGVSCAVRDDNALIFDCEALLPSEGAGAVFLEEPDGGLRPVQSTQDGALLDFVLWRLRAQAEYTVRVQPAAGAELQAVVRTGVVPDAHAIAPVVVGTPSWEALLLPHECNGGANLLLVDAAGEVLWYLPTSEGIAGAGFVDGFDASTGSVSAVLGRSGLRSWTWTQEPLLDLSWPGALAGPVHHDVVRHNGHVYALSAELVVGEDGLDYVMDQVLVFDALGAEVARWRMADAFPPAGGVAAPGGFWHAVFPDAWDFAHSNGISVEDDGDILLSSRIHHTVLRVEGDWSAADFGSVVWALSYDPASALGSDFGFSGTAVPGDFQEQHHPSRDDQGRLMLFDNRGFGASSRATIWELDELGMGATLVQAWDLGEHCPVQGSLFQVPGSDNVVATCASSQTVYEFSPDQAAPVARVSFPCAASGTRPLVVRAMPLEFGAL